MSHVLPLSLERVPDDVKEAYHQLVGRFGQVPTFYAVMAHRSAVLKQFLPFYTAITADGTIERTYKELAYLQVSLGNACAY